MLDPSEGFPRLAYLGPGAGWDGGREDFENCRRSARPIRAVGPWAHGPWALGPWAHGPWALGPWALGPWAHQENDENAYVTDRNALKCIRYGSPCLPTGSYSVETKRIAYRMSLEAFPGLQDLKNGPKTSKWIKNIEKTIFAVFWSLLFLQTIL